jgi:hypothetical protein
LSATVGCGRPPGPAVAPAVRVVDEAGALTEQQRQSIANYLDFIADERDVDYRVVVVGGARDELLSEGVTRYQSLGIGEATDGRGLLLVVDVAAGEARVEVGYDLEHRVRDVEAASMIRDLLAPYHAAGQTAMGVEASVERLVEILEPSRGEEAVGTPLIRSGGGGATALLEGIERLTPESRAKLAEIMIPQPNPEDCVELEMALMHRGIYYQGVSMYDAAWQRAVRPSMPARRLKAIAAEFDGPFLIARDGDYAIAYLEGEKARRWGPRFLRRTEAGWIIDATAGAEFIIYDYSNRWTAVDGDYPYLALIHSVYEMQAGTLRSRGPAWMMAQ